MNKSNTVSNEHPFAQYVRILGKGRKASRSLNFDESVKAMSMILDGEVEDIQLGAFLMLLRVKEESPEELAGFAQAVSHYIENKNQDLSEVLDKGFADIDWPSYAGKNKQAHWYILSILLLAQNGITTLCHGAAGHTANRVYTENIFSDFGFTISENLKDANTDIQKHGFTYLPLSQFCPRLNDIINLRNQFGLRSPVHSFSKLINPANCKNLMISTFHPSYKPVHQQACLQLNYKNAAIFKGESGEAEFRPHALVSVDTICEGASAKEQWPALMSEKLENEPELNTKQLSKIWRQSSHTDLKSIYAKNAVVGTCAIALKLCQKAQTQEEALAMAEQFWQQRNISLI